MEFNNNVWPEFVATLDGTGSGTILLVVFKIEKFVIREFIIQFAEYFFLG
jgi:hypothetical protein